MSDFETLIANAIRKADSSYFFENYTKQAQAVLAALKKDGWSLVPSTPTETMCKAGMDALPSGRVKPEKVAEVIYTAMIATAKK